MATLVNWVILRLGLSQPLTSCCSLAIAMVCWPLIEAAIGRTALYLHFNYAIGCTVKSVTK